MTEVIVIQKSLWYNHVKTSSIWCFWSFLILAKYFPVEGGVDSIHFRQNISEEAYFGFLCVKNDAISHIQSPQLIVLIVNTILLLENTL